MNNKTSPKGIALISSFEGFRNRMYLDQAGLPTIGFGHLIEKDDPLHLMTRQIDPKEGLEILAKDLIIAETCVNHYVKPSLIQNEFDALVSLVFNIGCGNFVLSSLLKLLNKNEFSLASQEFLKWNKVKIDGLLVESVGLTNRRKKEKELFIGMVG